MVAAMHVAALRGAGVRLAGVLSRRSKVAQAFAAQHETQAYASLEALVADRPDFVIVATPPDARSPFVTAFTEAKIPILMEKPIERDAARAEALVAQCEAAAVPLGVFLQHRQRPAALALMARLPELGQIATVEVRVPWWREQAYYDAPGRGTYARDGGGVLITQAIHTLDLMLVLAGPVEAVQAMTLSSPLHQLEAEDFAAAALQFRSGAVGSVVASTTHYPGGSEEIILNGTQGSAVLAANQLLIHRHGMAPEAVGEEAGSGGGADPMAFSHAWHQAVIEDFCAALHRGPRACDHRSLGLAGAGFD